MEGEPLWGRVWKPTLSLKIESYQLWKDDETKGGLLHRAGAPFDE